MSKYTTEVRYICETCAGLEESKGFDSVDSILSASAPRVFNFSFPIFDESYRLPLEVKILRHFYTREIGFETVGLWKLKMQDKLNLIMPYYNQLYRSTLIEFDPLREMDITKEHIGHLSGTTGKTGSASSSANTTGNISYSGEVNTTASNEGETNTTTTANNEVNGTTGNTRTNNLSSAVTSNGSEVLDRDVTITGSGSENTSQDRTIGTDEANSNTRWDLFSDTPQGGIDGIEGTGSTVGKDTYLTTARKITDNGSKNTDTSEELNGSVTTSNTNTTDEDSTTTSTYSSTTTNTGTVGDAGTNHQTTSGTENISQTNTTDNTTNQTSENSTETTQTSSTTGNTTENITINNTDDYIEHTFGKASTTSYAKLLTEFRKTFLNIDNMIVEELEPLFFGLW